MRPFLSRCADAVMARTIFGGWSHGNCPLCGGEPDFSLITPSAERLLICSRCVSRWRFHQLACPFCLNAGSLADHVVRHARRAVPPERLRRLPAVLKAFDGRNAPRPGDAGGRRDCDASARRRGGAARLQIGHWSSSPCVQSPSPSSSWVPAGIQDERPARTNVGTLEQTTWDLGRWDSSISVRL